MKELTIFIVCTLAVWRDTLMAVEEEGPFGVFQWVREHFDPLQKTWVGRGLNCQWCVSGWSALLFTLWLWYFGYVPAALIPIWSFGLSGGSVALSTIQTWMTTRRR